MSGKLCTKGTGGKASQLVYKNIFNKKFLEIYYIQLILNFSVLFFFKLIQIKKRKFQLIQNLQLWNKFRNCFKRRISFLVFWVWNVGFQVNKKIFDWFRVKNFFYQIQIDLKQNFWFRLDITLTQFATSRENKFRLDLRLNFGLILK